MEIRRRLIAVSLAGSLPGILLSPLDCRAGCLCDWLFKHHRPKTVATVPAPVVAPGVPATAVTAGYPPASTCGAAMCQQTVVRYVPQTAYRTALQPVPVTTYHTSTSINPANGLPMTCTRPCTSYTYQAQRVPYTTYRPVYTTVPVTLPPTGSLAATPAPTSVPAPSGYAPSLGGSYATSPGLAPQTEDPPGATPWSPVDSGGYAAAPLGGNGYVPNGYAPNGYGSNGYLPNGYASDGYAAGQYAAPATSDDVPGATPWRPVTEGSTSPSPPNGTPADLAPSLRRVPLPESFRQNGTDPRDNRESRRPEIQEGNGNAQDGDLQGPANHNQETRARGYDSRAVPDLDRERRGESYGVPGPNPNDKTAWRTEPTRVPTKMATVARESRDQAPRSAIPLRWAVDHRSSLDRGQEAASQAWQWRDQEPSSGEGWFPVR